MGKVYVIISGEYSDWNIEGYAETEEDAENICNAHNVKCGYYDWYYCEAEKLDKPDRIIKLHYVYKFECVQGTLKITGFRGPDVLYVDEDDAPKETTLDLSIICHPVLYVPLKEYDVEKAIKIANDYLAKFNAGRLGI